MHTQFSNNPLDVQTIYHHRSGCSTGFLLCPWLHVEQWRSAGDSIWFFEMSHHCTPFLSQSWSRRNTWEPATWTNWAWRPRQSLFTLWKCISMHMPIPSISKLSKPQTSFQNPVFGSSVWFPSKRNQVRWPKDWSLSLRWALMGRCTKCTNQGILFDAK